MSDQSNIPTLTDLIEPESEIKLSDLGLDDDFGIGADDPDVDDGLIEATGSDPSAVDPFAENPALEQTIRQILDQHLELAMLEIKRAIRRDSDES